jgi:hypothetical protein
MYPQVIQFETRQLEIERRLQLQDERRVGQQRPAARRRPRVGLLARLSRRLAA